MSAIAMLRPLSLVIGAVLALLATAQAQTPQPELFARLPAFANPSLSPDGAQVAFLRAERGLNLVGVLRFGDPDGARWINVGDQKARSLSWADNDVLLITVSATTSAPMAFASSYEFGGVFSVLTDEPGAAPVPLLARVRGIEMNSHFGDIQAIDRASGEVLIAVYGDLRAGMSFSRIPRLLYRVNARSGLARQEDRGNPLTYAWIHDETARPVARVSLTASGQNQIIETRTNRAGWRTVWRSQGEDDMVSVVGLAPDGQGLAFISREPHGRLLRMDMTTGETVEVLLDDPERHVIGAVTDPDTGRVSRVWLGGGGTTRWLIPEFAEWERMIADALPDAAAHIVSWSHDRSVLVVRTADPAHPPEFFVFRPAERSLDFLASAYPELRGRPLPRRERYHYTARDGVRIPGYLTRPEGEGPMPLVILPHGGPASFEVGGFDWFAHGLSSRGYLVLQPDFRGSAGYGREWERAGYGEWGIGVMQHDLTDGVRTLIEEGLADPDRVCIAGASYGGYAALAGVTFTPELYACAVAIAPVSDLVVMMTEESRGGRHNMAARYWRRNIGGDIGQERIRAASPARFADRVQAPVLLIHGRDDTVVPIEQSRIMERALRRAGRSVEFIAIDGEDHWLSVYESRVATLQAAVDFIDAHIGPDAR